MRKGLQIADLVAIGVLSLGPGVQDAETQVTGGRTYEVVLSDTHFRPSQTV